MTTDKNTSTFCVLPWIHSFVNSNGNYQVCCTSEEHHLAIEDDNGKFFNIKNNPTKEEIMNSKFMKKVRSDMLNGKWNKVCTRCLITENDNGVSRREIENKEYGDIKEELISNTLEDYSIKNVEFKSIDYRLGNLCNLECRMCGPHSSTKWLKDWNDVKTDSEKMNNLMREIYESYDWIDKDYLLSEFKSKLKTVEKLHFAGGEPLFTPQMAKMLKFCVDSDVAKNIVLTYNTNITRLPTQVLELWKQFKGVRLLCSIDGVGKVNEYIRYPSSWETIDKNLTFLDDHFEEYKLQEILLSCTVQIYNILQIHELYDYLSKFKNIVPAVNLINLHIPFYLRSTVLPPGVKKIAKENLLKCYEKYNLKVEDRYKYLIENIHQIINFMNQDDESKNLTVFLNVNSRIDEKKGIRFIDYLPELEAHLKNTREKTELTIDPSF